MPDQKNLLIAIVMSLIILIGFQYFIAPPQEPPPQQEVEQAAEGEGAGAGEGAATGDVGTLPPMEAGGETAPGTLPPGGQGSRRAALAESGPRVEISTPRLHGSIALTGGRIDDLTLADYHLTIDPASPEIVLLSPRAAPNPYYAMFGWRGPADMPTPTGETEWTADRETLTPGNPVTLTWDNGQGLAFEREIAVDDDYMFTITQRVRNTTDEAVPLAPYGRVLRFGTPETLGYFILHEGPYGVFNGTLEEYGYDDIQDDGQVDYSTTGGWIGFTDKYWLVSLIPDQDMAVDAAFNYEERGPAEYYAATFIAENAWSVAPGETVEATSRLFAGAKVVELIDAYEQAYGIDNFDLAIDFGWFYFLTKPFFYALSWLYDLVGNFGVAILIFTVGIKLLFFPLSNKSYKAMSKMKALQPEMMRLRERFSDDRQKMNMELMQLYKREKVNPAAGCLPILIQIPVFFALYKVLFVTIEMRHAPFFGWIQDLSVPDPTSIFNLFGLIPFDPPYVLQIGVWPLIMGLTMWAQQKLNPPPTDPMQQKIFMALPIVFTFMLAHFPAGLVIYWAWNNLLSIAQQYVIMRRMGVKIGGGSEPHSQAREVERHASRRTGKREAEEAAAEVGPVEAAAEGAEAAAEEPAGAEPAAARGEGRPPGETGAPVRATKRPAARGGAQRKRSAGGKRRRS